MLLNYNLDVTVPLSAYTIQQDFINNPNDTDRGPSYFKHIPALLRHNPSDFIAHTFTVGETFQTNSTLFGPYRLRTAYSLRGDGNQALVYKELLAFAFKNYDLSRCDVSNITLDLRFSSTAGPGVVGANVCLQWTYPCLCVSHWRNRFSY